MIVDSLSRGYRRHDVPDEYIYLWQGIVDSIATIFDVPVVLITRVHETEMEVLVRCNSEKNPFNTGEMAQLNSGYYCEKVMAERSVLEVLDARVSPDWKENPDLEHGLIFYLGVPLLWPNGETFGTLCIMDFIPRRIDETMQGTLLSFKETFERDMVINARNAELTQAYRELQEREEQINLQHQRLKNILEITQTGTWQWHVETNEIIVDEQWARLLGYQLSEIEPVTLATWEQAVHPDDLQRAREKVGQILEGQISQYNVEFRMKHKDGNWVWINAVGNVLRTYYDGKPLVMGGFHTDITARKRQEAVIEQQEDTYRRIFQSNLAMKLIIDPETGEILEANQTALDFYGYTMDEIRAMKISDINTMPLEAVKEEMQKAASERRAYFAFQHRKKSGEICDVAVYSGPIRKQGKDVLYSIILDVTHFKRRGNR